MLFTTGTEHCAGAGIEKTAVTAMPGSALKCSITKLPIAPQPITAIFKEHPLCLVDHRKRISMRVNGWPVIMLTMWST